MRYFVSWRVLRLSRRSYLSRGHLVVTLFNVVEFQPDDGGSTELWNVGDLLQTLHGVTTQKTTTCYTVIHLSSLNV